MAEDMPYADSMYTMIDGEWIVCGQHTRRVEVDKTTVWMMVTNGIIASGVWLTLVLLLTGVI